MKIIVYILSIVLANVVTAAFHPINMGVFIVPCGTLLIGLTFIFRDLVQHQFGRKTTYIVIISALILSAISSKLLGDTLWIVFASAVSFVVSESSDTEIFTRLNTTFAKKVLYSGLIGGLLDSSIFVIIGLSPLGVGFVPWNGVIFAILGQVIVKSVLQYIGFLVFNSIKKYTVNN